MESGARHSELEYIHFLEIAYGSCREVEYQIGLSHRLGFLGASSHTELQEIVTETAKVLNYSKAAPSTVEEREEERLLRLLSLFEGWCI